MGAEELCKLFKAFLAAESKMIKGLEERSTMCGVPADVIKQVKASHGKGSETGKTDLRGGGTRAAAGRSEPERCAGHHADGAGFDRPQARGRAPSTPSKAVR